jgi:Septin
LKPLDIEIMKRLGTRVNLIPVIAKADTLTQNDLALFKARVSIFCPAVVRGRILIVILDVFTVRFGM